MKTQPMYASRLLSRFFLLLLCVLAGAQSLASTSTITFHNQGTGTAYSVGLYYNGCAISIFGQPTPSTIPAGGTATLVLSGWTGWSGQAYASCRSSDASTLYCGEHKNVTFDGTFDFWILGGGVTNGVPPASTNCWAVHYRNMSFDKQIVTVMSNGIPFLSQAVGKGLTFDFVNCTTNSLGGPWTLQVMNTDYQVLTNYNGLQWTNSADPGTQVATSDPGASSSALYTGGTNAVPGASIGENAIYGALYSLDRNLARELTQVGITNQLSVSNAVSVTVSNTLVNTNSEYWASNLYVFATNTSRLTNYTRGADTGSNLISQVTGMFQAYSNAASGLGGFGDGTPYAELPMDYGAGMGPYQFAFALPTLKLDGNDSQYAVFSWVRRVWAAMVYFWLLYSIWEDLRKGVATVVATQQARTAGEAIVGTNANAAAALACGVFIAALVVTLLAAGLAFLAPVSVFLGNAISLLTGMESALGAAWGFACMVCPVDTICWCAVSRWVAKAAVDFLSYGIALAVKVTTGL